MSQYLLDTNICIHWSKDEFELRQKLRHVGVENCFISELTIAELLYGIAKGAMYSNPPTGIHSTFCNNFSPVVSC